LGDTGERNDKHNGWWTKIEDTPVPQIKRVLLRIAGGNWGADFAFQDVSIRWRDVRNLDRETRSSPRASELRPPIYPFELIRQGIAGEAKVEFVVQESGQINSLKITATNKELEAAVLEASYHWRFEPGVDLQTRLPAATRMSLTIKFNLDDP